MEEKLKEKECKRASAVMCEAKRFPRRPNTTSSSSPTKNMDFPLKEKNHRISLMWMVSVECTLYSVCTVNKSGTLSERHSPSYAKWIVVVVVDDVRVCARVEYICECVGRQRIYICDKMADSYSSHTLIFFPFAEGKQWFQNACKQTNQPTNHPLAVLEFLSGWLASVCVHNRLHDNKIWACES